MATISSHFTVDTFPLCMYEGCSESNALYVMMLAHDIRGGCWYYSSRGWAFPPNISSHVVAVWQMAAEGHSDTMCLIWKCRWTKGVLLNSSMRQKWHPLTFIDACWTFMETKEWMWTQQRGGWCISAVVTVTVGHFWCRLLWERYAGSCLSLVKIHS